MARSDRGRLTRGQTNFFAFGVRDADRLLRRNKSTVQRGRKTPGPGTGHCWLLRERERERRSTEAVPARAHVFEITINIGRQLAGMFSQMIRAPDIYQSYVSTCRGILARGKSVPTPCHRRHRHYYRHRSERAANFERGASDDIGLGASLLAIANK